MHPVLAVLGQAPVLPPAGSRVAAIDLARGVAIALMMISHAVSGLMSLGDVPPWGMVPVHLLTKFSSSLFIVVFGAGLGLAFLPKTGEPDWPRRRRRLLVRGLEVFFAYQALTVVEMLPFFPVADIRGALLFQRSAIWVEILCFYAIALLWIPWLLPLWRRMPLWSRLLAPILVAWVSWRLELAGDLFGSPTLKAVFVEDADYYTWGQLSRLPLVLLGLLLGELVLRFYRPGAHSLPVLVIGLGGAAMLLAFFAISIPHGLYDSLLAVSWNTGKHPPNLSFMLFSLGGALVILSSCLLAGERLGKLLAPLRTIGSEPLAAFTFHIVVIFFVLRFLMDGLLSFSYPMVLIVGMALIPATAAWISLLGWIRAHRRKP
ncbi:MAG: heparan-alpha-glucosaminide N-acetyltransferase domain-containing protein [Myxococcota bacterium]